MIKSFTPLEVHDINALEQFNRDLEMILEDLDAGLINLKEQQAKNEFYTLIKSFVMGQRGSLGRTKKGSWSIAPNDDGMDADNRVDYIFKPTYLVTAILSRTLCEFPLFAVSIPFYGKALRKGMLFCSYRSLYGHGYERDQGAAEALTILSMGKIPWLLEKNPSFCPELHMAIKHVSIEMQERLELGLAFGPWGEDLQDTFNAALETLYIKNDKEMYETIKHTSKDSELVGEEALLW